MTNGTGRFSGSVVARRGNSAVAADWALARHDLWEVDQSGQRQIDLFDLGAEPICSPRPRRPINSSSVSFNGVDMRSAATDSVELHVGSWVRSAAPWCQFDSWCSITRSQGLHR